jgi:hypothetical protein
LGEAHSEIEALRESIVNRNVNGANWFLHHQIRIVASLALFHVIQLGAVIEKHLCIDDSMQVHTADTSVSQ